MNLGATHSVPVYFIGRDRMCSKVGLNGRLEQLKNNTILKKFLFGVSFLRLLSYEKRVCQR